VTFVLEGTNLWFFGVCFLMALFISMSEFSAPDVKLDGCKYHPNMKGKVTVTP